MLALQGGGGSRSPRAEFFDRGFPRSFLLLEELTEELRASEKAAYGKLIRMMSHEINNSVGAVGSLLDSFRGYGGQLGEEDRRGLHAGDDGGDHAPGEPARLHERLRGGGPPAAAGSPADATSSSSSTRS